MSDAFTFTCDALGDDLRVLGFHAVEEISTLYEVEIVFQTDEPRDDEEALGTRATLNVERSDGPPVAFHGVLASVELLGRVGERAAYRAVLVPEVWHLAHSLHSRIFVNESLPAILQTVLHEAGMTPQDYTMELAESYEPFDHVCQYRESNWDFLARWMEREGMYFHFEHGASSERLIVRDSKNYQTPSGANPVRFYDAGVGDVTHVHAFRTFRRRRRTVPSRVVVANYDYLRPTLALAASEDVDAKGGETRVRGQNARSPAHAKRLSRVRSEELKARATVYEGEGPVLDVRVGYTFKLEDHPFDDLNATYLATRIEHFGSAIGADAEALSGLLALADDAARNDTYRVKVSAILASTQFRAEQRTAAPRVDGVEGGTVDGPSDSEYAQLDDHGRYLVKMRFDEGQQAAGAASTRVRMLQPYGGNPEGFHFPLRKGTEVLVVFLGGDPDRPVIAGAVPNAHKPSVVTAHNKTRNVIHTSGGNRIQIEDLAGSQHVRLSSPHLKSYTHIGAPNDSHNHISYTLGNSLSATGVDAETNVGATRLTVIGGFLFNAETTDTPTSSVTTTTFFDSSGMAIGSTVVTQPLNADGSPNGASKTVSTGIISGSTVDPTKTKTSTSFTIGSVSKATVTPTGPSDPLLNEAWQVSSLNNQAMSGASHAANNTIGNSDDFSGTPVGDLNLIGIVDPFPTTYPAGSDIKYVMGDNVTKVKQNSLSAVMGDSWSHVYGTAHSQIDGDSHGNITGNQTSVVEHNANSFIQGGRQTEILLNDFYFNFGAKESIVLFGSASFTMCDQLGVVIGGQQSIVAGIDGRFNYTAGPATSVVTGPATSTVFGMATSNHFGVSVNSYLGARVTITGGTGTETHSVRIANEGISVEQKQTALSNAGVVVQNHQVHVASPDLMVVN